MVFTKLKLSSQKRVVLRLLSRKRVKCNYIKRLLYGWNQSLSLPWPTLHFICNKLCKDYKQCGSLIPSNATQRTPKIWIEIQIYMPEHSQGWAYSIRMRLLSPEEEGYKLASERGFETCQLTDRHWVGLLCFTSARCQQAQFVDDKRGWKVVLATCERKGCNRNVSDSLRRRME